MEELGLVSTKSQLKFHEGVCQRSQKSLSRPHSTIFLIGINTLYWVCEVETIYELNPCDGDKPNKM